MTTTPITAHALLTKAMQLSPLCRKVVDFMERTGSISARDAFTDLGITSASLTRRLTDMENVGIPIKRERKTHRATGGRYTRYSIIKADRA